MTQFGAFLSQLGTKAKLFVQINYQNKKTWSEKFPTMFKSNRVRTHFKVSCLD
jgi:hypothetical protein